MQRNLAVHVALVALLLRALIPAGWMPAAQAAEAGAPLVICSVAGHPPLDSGEHPARQHNDVCPFAAAPPLSPSAVPAALAAPAEIGRADFASIASPFVQSRIPSAAHPRGPPLPA